MTDISVIGLGVMGSALARAFVAGGYSVTVWNRSAGKAEALIAEGAVATKTAPDAVAASPITITCVASHVQTIEMLKDVGEGLAGKTIVELSTGGASDARTLAALVETNGGSWLIGIINAYPTMIGEEGTVLSVVGDPETWARCEPAIKTLGGGSVHVGTDAGMLAALFAALFTTRQGFMFGMIYGGFVCRKAGIPLESFAELVPITMGVLPGYHQYFSDTAPSGNFDNPPATMQTYAAALDDALQTFDELGAPNDLPKLFSQLAHKGVDAGLSDKALTALVHLLDLE